MNNALLKDNLAARAVDSQTRKVFSRSGLIAGLCLSSLVSSYAIPGGVDATKAKNESVMITQQAKRVSGVVTDSAGEPIPGANVVQKETTNGTVTDMNGKYTLDVPNNATSVSYTHLRAHETGRNLVCRLLLEKIFFFNDTATTEIYT